MMGLSNPYPDPVCGTHMENERDFIEYEQEGKSNYFCSDAFRFYPRRSR